MIAWQFTNSTDDLCLGQRWQIGIATLRLFSTACPVSTSVPVNGKFDVVHQQYGVMRVGYPIDQLVPFSEFRARFGIGKESYMQFERDARRQGVNVSRLYGLKRHLDLDVAVMELGYVAGFKRLEPHVSALDEAAIGVH